MQKVSRLFEALTGEIHHRPIVGLLAVLVLLLHLWLVMFLMQPSDTDKETKPLRVMEVALLSEPSQKAEPEVTPPAPPKKVPPKKKEVKPPVKKKEPVVPKKVERPIPQPIADKPTPMQPSTADAIPTPDTSASPALPANKPTKTGSGEAPIKSVDSGVVPLVRVKPTYPMRAASRHIEGWVKIEFTVSPSGTVANARVVDASPPGIFDEAALDAIKEWKFKPKIENGATVTQRAVQTLKFTLLK
ncbi:TonB family protein [Methyloglobulus morosus KoM1]|uniref:Protein TonB n=1 Tax=Methyloglobulus morosus KoM1 TaxID=1116472 RepID=V5BHX5_9GAMM|nr:energy transducer TonB [Methyloglobulus morosus]ESS72910.1 TonB family protein [Methyloglobulus morosus KoM1]